MTREELLEDVNIGDIVKLYTESNEIFAGRILDFGSSGLKINMIESNKTKRIMYSRIMEYDLEDEGEKSVQSKNDIAASEEKERFNNSANVATIEENVIIDRKELFAVENTNIDLEKIRQEYLKKLDTEQKSDYTRIQNILSYAKKVHEYNINSERVKKGIIELKKLAERDKIFNVFIGMIYHEFGDAVQAKKYYLLAGAYVAAFIASLNLDDDSDGYKIALAALSENSEDEGIVQWLCEYAVKNNDISVIKYLINKVPDLKGNIALYWYADSNEKEKLPNREDILSVENIDYLCEIILQEPIDISSIEEIVKKVKEDKETQEKQNQNSIREGLVSYYNKNGGNGTIKDSEGGQIYFYIKQVKDINLQRILTTETSIKRKVTYTLGINFKGEIAADEISLMENDNIYEETIEEYAYEGFMEDYDFLQEFGRIRSGNKTYSFVFRDIKDPLLLAEMESSFNILELDVKFNVKNYEGKKKKKVKVAYDIIGKKDYSKEEIEEFIKHKYVTRREVNEWLGIEKDNKQIYFREVSYEPLMPIDSITYQKPREINVSKRMIKNPTGTTEMERKAVELIVPKYEENPFSIMPKISSKEKYFQKAHQFMVGRKNYNGDVIGIDLEKSEELFIKAIQANEQIVSAVANLANVYVKQGGEYIVKGLQLLETYGYLLSKEKLANLKIQLIDKSGNLEALELILLASIPNCLKKNTKWQYTAKLAGIYYKQNKWDEAAEWFQKSLKYLDDNKSTFPQYEKLRIGNCRNMIISYYLSGDKETAIKYAKKYIVTLPDDPAIKSILEDSFKMEEFGMVIDNIEKMDLQYEDEFIEGKNGDISQFLNQKLLNVNLGSTFNKVNEVYSKTQDGIFMGDSNDVKKVVNYIETNILRKNKPGLNAEYRSTIYIGIARIIYDSRNNANNANDTKLAMEEVKKYLARYARYTADSFVEKYAAIDSIRFLYIQALRYLVKGDDGNKIASINMLVATFFVESTLLTEQLHEMKNNVYKDNYYKMPCVSIKDFLIATFMLQEKKEYVNMILKKIDAEPELRKKMSETLCAITNNDVALTSYYEFEDSWRKAKGIYYDNLAHIGKEVAASVNEYHMVESIRQHVQKMEELIDVKLLWNQDEYYLKMFIKVIAAIGNTFEKYTVEEKIEDFRNVKSEMEKLKSEIEDSPTELSYDYIYVNLEELRDSIEQEFNDLYLSSQPECEIFLSNNSVYVNENIVEIAIAFKNAEDKQDADAVEIELKGSEGATFVKCEKKFTSIRSGEEQEYLAVFELDNNVIEDKQFEVTVHMKYRYRVSVESIKIFDTSEILPVNISSKENFVEVVNQYDKICRGSSVDVKTPELFKGRNDLIDNICASLSLKEGIMIKNRGIILWGQRRVGKNSVKDYLKEKIRIEYPGAYLMIELGSIGKCRNLREVLITIINKTEDVLMTEHEELYEMLIDNGMEFNGYALEQTENYMPEFSRFMDRFSTKLKKVSSSEKNIPLYFMDEFSYLYEWIEKGEIDGKEFMRFWKSFIQDYGICSIIIAQDNIPVWKSRYENEFACMNHDNEITYLDFEGAKELICEPCQVGDKPLFTADAVKLIYNWTKGSAYLIVIFCKHIIDYLNANYTERATKTIVQIVFEKEFIDQKGMFNLDDFEPQIQDVANVGDEGELINHLNEKLLKEIACATISSPQVKIEELKFFNEGNDVQVRKVFERLKERKIIEVEKDTYCSISMPLLKLFLLREQSLLTRDVLDKLIR